MCKFHLSHYIRPGKTELQKFSILVSRIPDIFGRESGHFKIAATKPSIFGMKRLECSGFKAQFNPKLMELSKKHAYI